MDAPVKKVLLVTNIPNPYRLPLFNELHRQLTAAGMKLYVLFGAGGYDRRKFELDWKEAEFQYEILGSRGLNVGGREKTMMTYGGLRGAIRRNKPDLIIVSGFSLATLKLWLLSFSRRLPYIIWSGSVLFPGWYDSAARRWLRKRMIKRATAYIAYGSKAKEYFVEMGADPGKVHVAINTVDTSFFSGETKRLRTEPSHDGRRHLLYIGYLEPRKNVSNLLELAAKLMQRRKDFVLDIVGSGSEEVLLKQKAEDLQLADFVRFHGFRQKAELPAFFARASCFLFQTDFDIWGLVLNEAMAAGLPCLASKSAGAVTDLLDHGVNGYIVDYRDQDSVLGYLEGVLNHPAEARAMGDRAAATIRERATLEISAAGFMKAILSAPQPPKGE